MPLHAVIKGKEDRRKWKEVADLIGFSSTGSTFQMPRKCEVGTLVSLMIPLPAHMRYYDYERELYQVWGLVQHCELMSADDLTRFHIGVAFIGSRCPESYKADPTQQYRIAGVNKNGMWRVEESQTRFKKRRDVRFWESVDLYLALIDTQEGLTGGERTTAENISRSGAAVFTTLNVGIGDRVKFISELYDFSGLAVVCNAQLMDDGRRRLHLKFVENTFPVRKLMKALSKPETEKVWI